MLKKSTKQIICALALHSALLTLAHAGVIIDDEGWTRVTPSPDSRVIYVSSSEGDDANDGLSPGSPKATIEAGNARLRDKHPDHLLLKRGDTFTFSSSTGLYRWKNGRGPQEPILISSYGDSGPRPIVKITSSFINHDGERRDWQAIIGLEIYKSNSDPDSPDFTNAGGSSPLRLVGGGDNILIEDNLIRFGMITIQSTGNDFYTEAKIRRNIILDVWAHNSYYDHDGRIQGIYISGTTGYLIEENFIDHCGWSEVVEGAGANMFNHNIYIQYSNAAGGVMRGNVLARGAAHGMQARSGGLVQRNLFSENAVSVNIGGQHEPEDEDVYLFNNQYDANVILSGRLMDPVGDNEYPRTGAVWGLATSYISDVIASDNIIANRIGSGNNQAFPGADMAIMSDNIVYEWDKNYNATNASWPHPEADLGDYNASLGGDNTREAYYNRQRERGPGELPWELTAYAANNYIREGFNKEPLGGFYTYPGQPQVAASDVEIIPGTSSLNTGKSTSYSYRMSPANASNPNVTWSSSNPEVAIVYDYGRVRALSAGTTTITVTTMDGSFTDSAELTVSGNPIPPSSIELSVNLFAMETPDTRQLSALVLPFNATERGIIWSSSNPAIASVDETGLVTALSPGSTVISATTVSGGLFDRAPVSVIAGTPTWVGYQMDEDGNVDTGSWLGWLNIKDDWIWMYSLNKFVFLPEDSVTGTGSWIFFPKS